MIRVMLVDDQAMVRRAFALMLDLEDDIDLVGEAADGAEAVSKARTLRPDVVLMDVEMPQVNGLDATRQICRESDSPEVIILTTFDRDDYVFDALQAGAAGFLLKNAEPEQLLESVRTVARGDALLAPEVTRRVIARAVGEQRHRPASPGLASLTAREREVLVLVARGLSNAEIADQLVLGEATIKSHVSNCLAKLGVRDRVQAVIHAFKYGLMDD
ncbi:response regulator [Parenemella sanctibonifatiensis]|uniref:DNA-binding response regulator n=1 Tax=Parenemella sanctibonifatiensis TaxID=2016505 RepID=A0A255DXM7_9ACTN|nr:response regulator transcription factor [Parenemella sanctibonifatiensis]OYN84079.1 DNA-binding response regulator [Parenemella sanctibonifatiensis]